IVQLAGKAPASGRFPREAAGIKVQQKCQRLHFLHATGYGKVSDETTQIGSYVVHFTTNRTSLEIPIVYGNDVRDWHAMEGEPKAGKDLKVVWEGDNTISKAHNHHVRLFLTTWENILPQMEIDRIDYVSAMANPAPFLIAVTAE